ncbi:MAG: hypothetical protein ACLR8H_11535 [Clostridium sp.]
MIEAPHTYSEWVNVLTIFKNKTNDEEVLHAMKAGTIEWQSGVAERFSKKLIDSVNARMNVASDKFQLELSRAYGSEGAIVQAILTLRKEMAFLSEAIDLAVLPEKDRQYYVNLVFEQANSMQKSLEDSAKNDRSGKLSSIIRNHKVNSF